MKFTNISPSGDLYVPGLGTVPAGTSVEVSGPLAGQFSAQPDNWKKVSEK
jgi:hypothetical protein